MIRTQLIFMIQSRGRGSSLQMGSYAFVRTEEKIMDQCIFADGQSLVMHSAHQPTFGLRQLNQFQIRQCSVGE